MGRESTDEAVSWADGNPAPGESNGVRTAWLDRRLSPGCLPFPNGGKRWGFMVSVPSPWSAAAGWNLEHSYARLPSSLLARVQPTAVRSPRLVAFNAPLARELGFDPEFLAGADAAQLFSGTVLPEGADPIAQAYAGHQFGHFTVLGDGRAILLGEQRTPSGALRDIQLKGPGRTPYSRGGDGRAALGPMLREYLISEAIQALGVPTTRSLAVVATGEPVFRENTLPGAVLVRVAASHLRVGTFEYAAARGDREVLQALLDYAIARHDAELEPGSGRALAWLRAVAERQASLLARWLQVGFVHGVMNTDNMAISGETIDYGPCAFLDAYSPGAVFSSIDHQSRYSLGNQPRIAQWNLARLAEAVLPLLDPDEARAVDEANAVLEAFPARFRELWLAGMRDKLGLVGVQPGDAALIEDLLEWMTEQRADYTNTFRDLSAEVLPPDPRWESGGFQSWKTRWQQRLEGQSPAPRESRERMRRHNPAFIPRNERVEEALQAASEGGDLGPFERLLEVVRNPFDHARILPEFSTPPGPDAPRYRTFCGT